MARKWVEVVGGNKKNSLGFSKFHTFQILYDVVLYHIISNITLYVVSVDFHLDQI